MPAYRLHVLGFLASKELAEELEGTTEPCGNQGFWDQRAALYDLERVACAHIGYADCYSREWTYHNIMFFGGNASNITVAGYSAGEWITSILVREHALQALPVSTTTPRPT